MSLIKYKSKTEKIEDARSGLYTIRMKKYLLSDQNICNLFWFIKYILIRERIFFHSHQKQNRWATYQNVVLGSNNKIRIDKIIHLCRVWKVCDDICLKLFQGEELKLLICGSPDVDFSVIEEATKYDNGYIRYHPTIIAFWDIVHNMNTDEKKSLLPFVTGSDRVPLKGLSSVAFQIIKHGEDSDKLPTASTCFNVLMLPEYSSREKLRNRLFLAVQNSKGFGLTWLNSWWKWSSFIMHLNLNSLAERKRLLFDIVFTKFCRQLDENLTHCWLLEKLFCSRQSYHGTALLVLECQQIKSYSILSYWVNWEQ